MSEAPLSREKVLSAAHDVLRRHGPSKASVVDVAEALGVSHGSIYRFFPTKAALREAVVGAWLAAIADAVAQRQFTGSSLEKLKGWFLAFQDEKRRQRRAEPELFEAFRVLTPQEPDTIRAYKARLVDQVAALLTEGMARGEVRPLDPVPTARALLSATAKFSHPEFAHEWNAPQNETDFETLWALLARSISPERTSL
jgi:AcrR family transcriptional regulator